LSISDPPSGPLPEIREGESGGGFKKPGFIFREIIFSVKKQKYQKFVFGKNANLNSVKLITHKIRGIRC